MCSGFHIATRFHGVITVRKKSRWERSGCSLSHLRNHGRLSSDGKTGKYQGDGRATIK
jgi:hypothetical protein